MQFVQGYWFDNRTGEVFDEDMNLQPFTFEQPPPSYFNPFQFATQDTAEKVMRILVSLTLGNVKAEIVQDRLSGPVGPAPKRSIVVTEGDSRSEHNAGLVASTIMRQGWRGSSAMLKDELNRNGITVRL